MSKRQSSLFVPFLLILSLFLIMVTMYTSRYALSYMNYALSTRSRDSLILAQMCQVTKDIKHIRQYHNSSEVNPSQHVVEELLEIVTNNPDNLCMKSKHDSNLAVVIVSSRRGNIMERRLIRRTWGSVVKYRGWRIHTVFLLGQSDYCLSSPSLLLSERNKTIENQAISEELGLMEEFENYGDLVVGAFADTFKNQTYKHLMGYKFALESCADADLVIKTDDEMFVDIPKIVDMRMEELSQSSGNDLSDIYCHPYQDAPTRCQDCPNKKWFSTREEWPEDKYPQYCLGNDYIISLDWVKKIYSVRGQGGYFWVDDVFIMGKLREIAETNYGKVANRRNIRENVTDMRGFPYVKENCAKEEGAGEMLGMFVFLQSDSADFQMEVDCLWRRVLRRKSILTVKDD